MFTCVTCELHLILSYVKELQQPSETLNMLAGAHKLLFVKSDPAWQGKKVPSTGHCCGRTGRKCRSALPSTSSVSSEVRQIACEVCAGAGKRKKRKYSLSEWCKGGLYVRQARNCVPPIQVKMETDSPLLLMEDKSDVRIERMVIVCGCQGLEQQKEPRYQVTYHMHLASGV